MSEDGGFSQRTNTHPRRLAEGSRKAQAAEALSDALGGPSATLAGAATDAKLDELSQCAWAVSS